MNARWYLAAHQRLTLILLNRTIMQLLTRASPETLASRPLLSRQAHHAKVPALPPLFRRSRSDALRCLPEGKPIPGSRVHA